MSAKIGSLNIDAELNTARFEQGLGRMQSALRSQDAQVRQVAQSMSGNMDRAIRQIGDSQNRMRAGMQQLGFQMNDVAVQFASGTKATTIFAQQSGQVIQAIQLMSGGASRFGAFMAGPWGIALTTASVVAAGLAGKLFDTSDALDKVKFSSSAVGNAQNILAGVMDMATGKINTQSKALIALANAQLLVAKVQAQAKAAEARRAVADLQTPKFQIGGGFGGGISISRKMGIEGQVSKQLLAGVINGNQAVESLERMRAAGAITDKTFAQAAASVANLGVELENIKVLGNADKLLHGTGGRELLTPKTGGGRHTGGGGGGAKANPLADAAERFGIEMAQIDASILQVKRSNLVELKDIAALDLQQVQVENRRAMLAIDKEVADKHITAVQGRQLKASNAVLAAMKADQISAQLKAADLKENAQLMAALNDNDVDILRAQEALAVTAEDRRKIGLELLQHEKDQARANAQLTLTLYALGQATQRQAMAAQDTLNNLDRVYSLRADAVRNQTRGPLDQYISDMDPRQIGERVQGLIVDELEAVRHGIDDAISSALGVEDPLLKGLIDLFIQQVLINPIAQALQGAMGNGGGLFGSILGGVGGLFGGGGALSMGAVNAGVQSTLSQIPIMGAFASGTNSAPRGFALVGENGPELVRFRGGETVFPNGVKPAWNDNGASRPIEAHFHYHGEMSDRDRRMTSQQAMRDLRAEMGRAVRMGG